MRRFWTVDEIVILEAVYPDERPDLIAAELGRDIKAVYATGFVPELPAPEQPSGTPRLVKGRSQSGST